MPQIITLKIIRLQKTLSIKLIRGTLMDEHFISIDGNKIRYLEEGQSDRSLILIHGLGASAERWEFAIPYFKKNFHIIVPDLIGFGQSEKPLVDYTTEFFGDFLSKFVEKLHLHGSDIVGSSLGGQISAEFVSENNSDVGKLVLVSPSGAMKQSTPALDAYVMAALYPSPESAQNAFLMMSGAREIRANIVESFVQRMKMPNAKMAFMSTLLGLKNSSDISTKLEKISVPTMIIWGKLDPVIPIEHSTEFLTKIKDSKFEIMENCGHTPYVDEPEKFAKIVTDFLLV